MDLKTNDIGQSTVHIKMDEMPNALASGNVASIKVLFDFVIAGSKLHGDAIMAFVHILEDILGGLD